MIIESERQEKVIDRYFAEAGLVSVPTHIESVLIAREYDFRVAFLGSSSVSFESIFQEFNL